MHPKIIACVTLGRAEVLVFSNTIHQGSTKIVLAKDTLHGNKTLCSFQFKLKKKEEEGFYICHCYSSGTFIDLLSTETLVDHVMWLIILSSESLRLTLLGVIM